MEKQDVLKCIIDCVSAYTDVPKEKITEKTHLSKELGLDSLSLMTLMCTLEEKFKISIDETCFLSVTTIGNVEEYILKRIS